jgi:hypothetical protein
MTNTKYLFCNYLCFAVYGVVPSGNIRRGCFVKRFSYWQSRYEVFCEITARLVHGYHCTDVLLPARLLFITFRIPVVAIATVLGVSRTVRASRRRRKWHVALTVACRWKSTGRAGRWQWRGAPSRYQAARTHGKAQARERGRVVT